MILRFLGTGTSHGVPMIGCDCEVCTSTDPRDRRMRSSVMIKTDLAHVVIDCGPDFRSQMLASGTSQVDALLITHEHSDHVAGLDDVRAVNYAMGKDMTIYLDQRTAQSIRVRYHYAFEQSHAGVPHFNLKEVVPGDHFEVGDMSIEVLRVHHGKLPILGYKVGDIVYLTDVKTLPDSTLQRIKNCKCLVISALRQKEHPAHLSLDESLDLIQTINPERAYLSHISHQLWLANQLDAILPDHVTAAFDGLEIIV